mgnify:CR=1 FL=1
MLKRLDLFLMISYNELNKAADIVMKKAMKKPMRR